MLTHNRDEKKYIFYILLLAVIMVGNAIIQSPSKGREGFIWPSPVTVHSSSVPEIWSLSNIYIDNIYVTNSAESQITALNGKLVVIGSNDISKYSTIMAFDEADGDLVWQVAQGGLSISSTASKVIVGGVGYVTARDDETGTVLWNTGVWTKIVEIIPKNNKLYVSGSISGPKYYVLDANNGKVLAEIRENSVNEQGPSVGNTVFLHDGNGDIFAVNKLDNQELWRNRANIISNLAVTPLFVYALSQDGSLLRFDLQTGKKEILTTFSPSGFELGSEQTIAFPYNVTVDAQTNMLFAYLGDSAQMFAFQIHTSK